MTVDTDHPVVVTGATGYVAGRLVERLLAEGLTVHAAVRDPDRRDRLAPLERLAERLPGRIRHFRADLLEPGSYAEAMAGCRIVFHTASPFSTVVGDPQRELVEPALEGTRNVLETAGCTDSVRRVVLTSSCAAVYGDNADLDETELGVFTEADWNTTSSLDHQPYSWSKTLAEREAWKLVREQDRWDLVVVNPSLVIGPAINPHARSESVEIVRQMGDGTMKAGVPDIGIGAVDVRDVAEGHFQVAFRPEARGRYILSGHDTSFPELVDLLRARYGGAFPLPRRTLPGWLVWLAGPMVNKAMTRRFVARNVGRPFRADNTRSRQELGIRYRALSESINALFEQLVKAGRIPRPRDGREA